MALLFECMGKCCRNMLDTADIVRDGDLSPITSLSSGTTRYRLQLENSIEDQPTVLECRLEARITPPYLPRNCAPKELFRCALVLCSLSCLHFAHLLLVRRLKPFSP